MNTRVAPSPTGYFHLGTARTAYFNYLMARATGGKFILRIDDTDQSRNKPEYIDNILSVFEWLDLEYDELHFQSKRQDLYLNVACQLVDSGYATPAGGAISADESITANLSPFIPQEWSDMIGGVVKTSEDDKRLTTEFVLIKQDGTPSYNFCSIVDDYDMNIGLVIRGVDHLKNTAKQLSVLHALAIKPPMQFCHVGLIFQGNKKMSKRDGGCLSVTDYRDKGYSPKALLNHILRLGWGHPDPNFDKTHKTVSKEEAIALIQEGNFRSAKSNHDIAKLDNLNKLWSK